MPDYLVQWRCRLVELGCPRVRLNRMVQEIADHREDLIRAASLEGFPSPEARAEAALGDPRTLAGDLIHSFRRSTWCGRHRLVAFGFLPLAFPVFWIAFLLFELWVGYGLVFGWDWHKVCVAFENPVIFHRGALMVYAASDVAMAAGTLLFCWLARRSGVSFGWLITACLICSIFGLLLFANVSPRNFSLGIYIVPQWSQAAMPWLVAAAVFLWHRWQVRLAREAIAEPR